MTRGVAAAVVLAGLGACGGGDGNVPIGTGSNVGPPPSTATAPMPTPAPAPSALIVLDASTSCALPNFKADLLQQINAARAQPRNCGAQAMPAAPALAWNDVLFSAAARHTLEMAQNNYFSHTGLNGSTPGQRLTAEGYAWRAYGENIAEGFSSVNAVMTGWLGSPEHCSNIMSASFVDVGVSCVQQTGTANGMFWTMDLARQ